MIDKLRKNETKSPIVSKGVNTNTNISNKNTFNKTIMSKPSDTISILKNGNLFTNATPYENYGLNNLNENQTRIRHGSLVPDKQKTHLLKKEIVENSLKTKRISNFIINSKNKNESITYRSPYKNSERESLITPELKKNDYANVFYSPRKSDYDGEGKSNIFTKRPDSVNFNCASPYTIKYPGAPTSNMTSPISNMRNSTNYKSKSCIHSPINIRSPSRQSFANSNEFNNLYEVFDDSKDIRNIGRSVMTPRESMEQFSEHDAYNQEMNMSLLSMNKDSTLGKGGRVEIFKTPNSKAAYKLFYDNYDSNKVTFIQSYWRGHFLRTQLYDMLIRYYKGLAFEKRINVFFKKIKGKLILNFFQCLKLYKRDKINKKFLTKKIKVNTVEMQILGSKSISSGTNISLDKMNELRVKIINEYKNSIAKSLAANKCESFSIEGSNKFSIELKNDILPDKNEEEIKNPQKQEKPENKKENNQKKMSRLKQATSLIYSIDLNLSSGGKSPESNKKLDFAKNIDSHSSKR